MELLQDTALQDQAVSYQAECGRQESPIEACLSWTQSALGAIHTRSSKAVLSVRHADTALPQTGEEEEESTYIKMPGNI